MLRLSLCALVVAFAETGGGVLWAQANTPRDFAVEISATVSVSPPAIQLTWPQSPRAMGYSVFRKSQDTNWTHLSSLGVVTEFTDSNVEVGRVYEYRIERATDRDFTGFGYLDAAIQAPMMDDRGKIILVVDQSHAAALAAELDRWVNDATGDGWNVVRLEVSRSDSPVTVRDRIQTVYESDPENVRAAFLFGRIPVPYSGNIYPDGHLNHQGAWPADSYYAELTSEWTDSSVTSTNAERQINWNVPGDGKFDQNVIPSAVELQVGRVDFADMTNFSNKEDARSERDLLRQYLNKNHEFRHGAMAVARRGIIADNFGVDKGDDPIVNSAWRNYAAFFGPGNVTTVGWDEWFPEVEANDYLWSYTAGGGTYYISHGVGTSDQFALKDARVVFAMVMGSYFGDWNNESNFMRSTLGSGNVLASFYAGFPHWHVRRMALGETIGWVARFTQNVRGTSVYEGSYPPNNQGTGEVHIALLGDPTLRMHPVIPPSSLSVEVSPGVAQLQWAASGDSSIVGYHVYRASALEGAFDRITGGAPLTSQTWTDSRPEGGDFVYMVRAVKLETSSSGTYFNPSQAIFQAVQVPAGIQPPPAPYDLAVTALSSSELELSWNAEGSMMDEFVLERRQTDGEFAVVLTAAEDERMAVDSGLAPDTAYDYRIKAVNGAGSSEYSNVASGRTLPPPLEAPAAPYDLAVTVLSSSDLELSWNAEGSPVGEFVVERREAFGGEFAVVLTAAEDERMAVDSGLPADTAYDYRIKAVNGAGSSEYSNVASGRTLPPPLEAPQAPSGLSAEVLGKASIQLEWIDVEHEEGYVLERAAGDSEFSLIQTAGEDITSHTDEGLKAATEYRYRLRAFNEAGESPYSAIITASTDAEPIGLSPVSLALSLSEGDAIVRVSGVEGQTFVLELSDDFSVWKGAATNVLSGASMELRLPLAAGAEQMYCRAKTVE